MKAELIHQDIEEWAARALTDGLSESEKMLFQTHLAECATCAALYEKTEIMNQTLTDTFTRERPSAGFENQLIEAFRAREKASWFARVPATIAWLLSLRGVQTAGVLATLTLLVALGDRLTNPLLHKWGNGSRVAAVSGLPRQRELRLESRQINEGKDAEIADKQTRAAADGAAVGKEGRGYFGQVDDSLGGENNQTDYYPANGSKALDKKKFSLAQNDKKPALQIRTEPSANGAFDKELSTGRPAILSASPASPSLPPVPDLSPALVDARKLIRNATVELEVAAFDTALDKINTAATQAGGYVATKNSARGGNGKLRGTIIIKVLPQNLDAFLLELRTLGEVKNQTLATQDVTREYTDTAARLRNAQRMEERLLKMLDDAKGKISEILQVEKELGRVRESIEQMTGELKLYDSLVSYATVTLSFSEKDLNQPAAFLLRESGNLDLLAADVDQAYAETRRIAEAAHAEISNAQVNRDANGRVNVTLSLLIPAPAADRALTQLKALGRIASFHSTTERTAQNGSDSDSGSSQAKVENAPASFQISIQHDEQTHRQIAFTVFAQNLDPAFDAAKKAAADAGAEIVHSSLTRPRLGAGRATLVLRVSGPKHAELVANLQKIGRTSDYQVQRDAADSDTSEAPVLISLQLTDEEPSAQQTQLSLQATDIEKRVREFKTEAIAAGASISDSSFSRQPDGRETAQLVLRISLTKYSELLARAQALGKTQSLSVQRRDVSADLATDRSGPAELRLTLATETRIVAANTGLFATLRHTLSEAIRNLLWSVQMIGVALAFLAPWAIGLGATWLIVSRIRRRK